MNYDTSLVKEKVYTRLVDTISVEDYPVPSLQETNEGSVKDLVGDILIPSLASHIKISNNNNIRLRREMKIISKDNESGGYEEYIVVDLINTTSERILIIVEAKQSSLGEGLKQCALAIKVSYDINNDNRPVYGFVVTSGSWRLLVYSGNSFKLSGPMEVLTEQLESNKENWLQSHSIVIDVIYSIPE
ncbi:hypothetical protein HK099_008717 [Clydaea vesicula]|uniref:Uncharacterized protein n=1 Tax=Clydaea vesicula TaxID=447962 RepID=A0AAD5XXT0_9FUNG|nr:hypothetical protein HK099_008717 [Clydaea vesicula]